MPKIGFHINFSKTDKNDFAPIRAKIAVESRAVNKNLGLKIKVTKNSNGKFECARWDANKQRAANFRKAEKHYQDYIDINNFLDEYESKAKTFFKECTIKSVPLTVQLATKFFNNEYAGSNTPAKGFWGAYDEFLIYAIKTFEPNTSRMHKSNKNKLEEFQSSTGYKITFDSINLVFFDKLTDYILFEQEHGFNYLPAIIKRLKAFMNWSFERNYHKTREFKKFTSTEKSGSIIHLTESELKQLLHFPFESERLKKVRDFYCVGCLTGARYSDLKNLTKDNISDGKLIFTTQKTNTKISLPLFDGLKTIIDRYPQQHKLLPKISQQKLNDYIKEACEKAEITAQTEKKTFVKNSHKTIFYPKHKLLGTHTARKTFVCLAHSKNIDIPTIMACTGIKDYKTIERYLEVSPGTKEKALNTMFGDLG